VFTTFSQNLNPAIHKKASDLSTTEIRVKFWLRYRSPEHLFNSELFGNVLNKRQKMAGE